MIPKSFQLAPKQTCYAVTEIILRFQEHSLCFHLLFIPAVEIFAKICCYHIDCTKLHH